MKPKMVCANCSADINPTDKFCPSCGTKIDWDKPEDAVAPEKEQTKPKKAEGHVVCDVCGNRNESEARFCEACGAQLESHAGVTPPREKGTAGEPKRRGKRKRPEEKSISAGTVISVAAGIILVAFAVYIFVVDRGAPHVHDHPELGGTEQALMQEISRLEHMLEHEPDNIEIVLQLANLYHDARMFDPAIRYYHRYLEADPDNPDVRVDLGICYFEANQPDLAVEEVRKVTIEFPQHQLAAFNLGIIYLNLGEVGQANRFFARAVEINPENETGRRAQRIIQEHSF